MQEEIKQMLTETLYARASFYRMLSGLYFTEVTQDQVDAMAARDLSAAGCDELIVDGCSMITNYLKKRNSGTQQELAVDYARSVLAAGSYDQRVATPYESVFTSKNGCLMQDARDGVYKVFLEEHLAPREELHMPEDHLAFTFEFMAYLCDKTVEELENDDISGTLTTLELQKRFWREHLINWIDRYCDVFDDVCHTQFYGGVSKMTRGFVRRDGEAIDDLIEEVAQAVREKVSSENEALGHDA